MSHEPGIIWAEAEPHITQAQIESALLPLGLTLDLFNDEQEILGRGKVTQLLIRVPIGSEHVCVLTLTQQVPFITGVLFATAIDPYK